MKPYASKVVKTAAELIQREPPIPYVLGGETLAGLDCQGYIEYCVRQNGGTMSYAGSNEMWRSDSIWTGTLDEAKKKGYMVPGALLFIVENDGNEPDKYKQGGKSYKPGFEGNASHVGMYLKSPLAEVGHASSSRGKVSSSTLKNAWTHLSLSKNIDYTEFLDHYTDGGSGSGGSGQPTEPEQGGSQMPTGVERLHQVILPEDKAGQTVNFRKKPSIKSNTIVLARIPDRTYVMAGDMFTQNGINWKMVKYNGLNGYIIVDYLIDVSEGVQPETPENPEVPVVVPEVPVTDLSWEDRVKLLEAKVANIEKITGIRFGG